MTNPNESIEIRAHHGMCFYFFKGKGYSDGFTKKGTTEIIEAGLREKICGDCMWNDICR